jgi:hypothetical protein
MSSGAIFTSTIFNSVKLTLDAIVDDDTANSESTLVCKKWLKMGNQEDSYEDDLEMGGPGLASEVDEGQEIETGAIREGFITRYIARKFGLRLIVTDEAVEDNKYPEVLKLGKRLSRALYKTLDIDCTNILVRAQNAAYTGGDGVPLASASHTLPNGGTWSNTFATPLAPSRIAVGSAVSLMRKFPGHDGVTEGAEPKKIVHPTEQWMVWSGILNSTMAPEAGNFAEINAVKRDLDITPVSIKYWSNTSTNWGIITDADNGVQMRWRRKPRKNSWVENDNETMKYSITARWSRGWSDARGFFFSNA